MGGTLSAAPRPPWVGAEAINFEGVEGDLGVKDRCSTPKSMTTRSPFFSDHIPAIALG